MPKKLPFILHISAIKSWGGGEQQLVYLYQELAKQQVPQLIACRAHSALASYCQQQNLQHVTYSRIGSIDLNFARQLAKLCQQQPIDIIHTHDAHSQTAALLAKLLFKVKPIIIASRKVAFPLSNSWLSRYKYNSPHIRKIICISQAVKNTIAPRVQDANKLVVIHDGIELTRFAHIDTSYDLRQALQLEANLPLIGIAASLVASKDLFTFIAVAQQMISQGFNAKFVIIGEGPLKAELQAYAIQLGIANDVIFLGFRTDIPTLLPQLTVFMLTSRQEGMGSAILEAMASQVPVIATRVGGIPELINDGETGLLANSGDIKNLTAALIRLLTDKTLGQRLVEQAKQRLTHFTVAAMAAKTLTLYLSCTQQHGQQ